MAWRSLFVICTQLLAAYAFTDYWAWLSGSTSFNAPGKVNVAGIPMADYTPSARAGAFGWSHNSGLFVYGGSGFTGTTQGYLSDLWKFDFRYNQWMAVNTVPAFKPNNSPIYSAKGTYSFANNPGSRSNGAVFSTADSLYLFGGSGYDASNQFGLMNDFWRFNLGVNQWSWVGGPKTHGDGGSNSNLRGYAATNWPGSRMDAATWQTAGVFYLFGGKGSGGSRNDFWSYTLATGSWVWQGGNPQQFATASTPLAGTYGNKWQLAAGNYPAARQRATAWSTSQYLYMFGGAVGANGKLLNDMWQYNIQSGAWLWIAGSNQLSGAVPGSVFGTPGTGAFTNTPSGRAGSGSWVSGDGNTLFLLGGNTDGGYNQDFWSWNVMSGWAYLSGSTAYNPTGVYGSQKVPAQGNYPGGRAHMNTFQGQTDNGYWLFGGQNNAGRWNDLWVVGPVSNGQPCATNYDCISYYCTRGSCQINPSFFANAAGDNSTVSDEVNPAWSDTNTDDSQVQPSSGNALMAGTALIMLAAFMY